MKVRPSNVVGREAVRRGPKEVRCNLPLVIDDVLPEGLQKQGNP
jgi:hypothetical protein